MDHEHHDHHADLHAHGVEGSASFNLALTCAAMFVGAYVAGLLPGLLRVSNSKMQMVGLDL
jgi:hypothetical protein